jgi:hypothetical protein
VSEFRIVFDEDGYPRELRTAAERERAIARGALTRDTDVVVYRDGEPAYACKAGAIRALWSDPEPEPETPGAAPPAVPPVPPPAHRERDRPVPAPAPPAPIAPPPQRLARAPKPSLWSSLSLPAPAPPAPRPAKARKLSPPPPAAPARKKGGCMATLFWLFMIYLVLKAFA